MGPECRRRAPWLLLILVSFAASGGRAQGEETALIGKRIVAIEFVCTAPIDREGLSRLMPMRVGDELRAADLAQAHWRLEQKDIFTSITIDLQARADGVAVVIPLVRKPIIDAVRFRGNQTLSDRELRRVVRLRESMALTPELEGYAVKSVRDRYLAEGFDAVSVTAEVREREPGEVDVVFHIVEGEPLRVGAIELEGTLPIPADAIRHAIAINVGDRYVRERQRLADRAVVRLLRDRLFDEAQVDSVWELSSGRAGVLRFTIDAGPPFAVTFIGNRHFNDKHMLELIDLPNRPLVTDGTWRELARRAQQAYQEDGYYFAKVRVHIEEAVPKEVRFEISEGDVFHVTAVQFEGNRGLSAAQLRQPMATQPPSWVPWRRGFLLDNVLDDDLKRLWYLYRQHGFESAEIVDARTQVDRERHLIAIVIVVQEGVQTIVRALERDGLEPLAGTLPEPKVQIGAPLNPEDVDADRRALITALARQGYTRAEVTSTVSSELIASREAATVSFHAEPGARQYVGLIIVQNNIDTRGRTIRRELPFQTGQPLDPDALLRGQTDVYRLGLFRSVSIRPLDTDPPETTPPIGVNVAERPPGNLQFGAGYNTRDGFKGFLEVSRDNLQGLARRVSLRGEAAVQPDNAVPSDYLGNLGYRELHVADSSWTLRANLIGQRSTHTVDPFNFERFAFTPALERTVLPGLQAGVDAQFEQAQIFDLDADVEAFNPRDQGRLRTVSVGPYAFYDGRDDPLVPTRGVFEALHFRVAPSQLGSDVPFMKATAQHVHYVPLNPSVTFVYVVRVGWALAYENHDVVPIRDRFFLGGRTTVRGFGENDVGPEGSAGDPLGGDLSINLNTEVRFPLVYGFGGVVFVDGGGVYFQDHPDQPISIHNFRRSIGPGLRYITPIGPMALEYGFKLDRRSGESIGEVHFSIGPIF